MVVYELADLLEQKPKQQHYHIQCDHPEEEEQNAPHHAPSGAAAGTCLNPLVDRYAENDEKADNANDDIHGILPDRS